MKDLFQPSRTLRCLPLLLDGPRNHLLLRADRKRASEGLVMAAGCVDTAERMWALCRALEAQPSWSTMSALGWALDPTYPDPESPEPCLLRAMNVAVEDWSVELRERAMQLDAWLRKYPLVRGLHLVRDGATADEVESPPHVSLVSFWVGTEETCLWGAARDGSP